MLRGSPRLGKMENKKIWVISLGGSRIVPSDVDSDFLLKFKRLLDSHKDKRFVVVTGGGATARKYIGALKKLGKGMRLQSMEGIAVTRLHAGFLARIFGKEANEDMPLNMKRVKNLLRGNRIVFCGALRYQSKNTSDGTAAKLAGYLDCPFINLTNVRGLYSSNPKTNRRAQFISSISWGKFYEIASKVKFEAGQHFVLDGAAARVIWGKKIVTYIVGSLGAIDNILRGKKFIGTRIGE